MQYDHIQVPEGGEAITVNRDNSLNVPARPIVPFVVGDGIGIDVTPVMKDVVDAAVSRAYGGKREIEWMQVYAGQA
ncbi:MAG: NADP-dependent isocitrate dehydrogenase, partial [Woeseiaceae bacterium]